MDEQYDVFLSYAHADAETPAGRMLIDTLHDQITQALKPVSNKGENIVFLDTMALGWGNMWHDKIVSCLKHCKIFIYVLSPNYLASDYCRRERLWWAQKQLLAGRLFRGTLPVYYIDLSTIGTYEADRTIREVTAIQAGDKPFFESIRDIQENMILERIRSVRELDADKLRDLLKEEGAGGGFCSIRPRVSKYFVGRLAEMSDLAAMLSEGKIPVICADGGVGKSELAVAYAYAFADRYPGGRFLLRMEGIRDWTDAVLRMLNETAETETRSDFSVREYLCLPDDFNRIEPEKQHSLIIQRFLEISAEKPILLLLDNVDDCSLLKDTALQNLFAGRESRPQNIHLIATTRQGISSNSGSWTGKYELHALQESDAFELVCTIADNKFDFEKKPSEKRNDADILEYNALMRVITHLGGNAWALEVIAGFMSEHYGPAYDFQRLEREIRNNVPIQVGRGCRLAASDPAALLQPTLDLLAGKETEFHEEGHILELARAAAFFPPEQIPLSILEAYWTKYFGNEMLPTGDTCHRAIDLLRQFHIFNGEESPLKMHRLTNQVLRMQTPDSAEQCRRLSIVVKEFLDHTSNPSALLLTAIGNFYSGSLQMQGLLKQDKEYLSHALDICDPLRQNNQFQQETELLKELREDISGEDEDSLELKSLCLHLHGNLHRDLNQFKSAGEEYCEALKIRRILAEKNPAKFNEYVANTLNNLAYLHESSNQLVLAEEEYNESLKLRRSLAERNPSKFNGAVAEVLNDLAGLHRTVNQLVLAEEEYTESLKIRRILAEKNPAKFNEYVAKTLNNLAYLHESSNQLVLAEEEYTESLKIRRNLAEKNPAKFNEDVANTLNNLAGLHETANHLNLAEEEYTESLKLRRDLAEKNPAKFNGDVATLLNNLAGLHRTANHLNLAEEEYTESLKLRRGLAEKNPAKFNEDVATSLNNLAYLHESSNQLVLAEEEYTESLKLRRGLAEKNPAKFNEDVATSLNNLAGLHETANHLNLAEEEYTESLKIYQTLAEKNPAKFNEDVATLLNNLAYLHESSNQLALAEEEYTESLKLRRNLAEKNPAKFNEYVAISLNNLAGLHETANHLNLAEEEYTESLKLRRDLAEKNPAKFNEYVANTLNNLAYLHKRSNQLVLAEEEYTESLKLRRDLAEKNPAKFNEYVAKTLNNLANLHESSNQLFLAEEEYNESLKLRRGLAEKNPAKFNEDVAASLNNLAGLHRTVNHPNLAEEEYNESLKLRRGLAEKNPAKFNEYVAKTLNNLANLHERSNQLVLAEKECNEALKIYRDLAENNPQRFEPEVARLLDQAARWHCAGASLWKRIFSAKVRTAYRQGLAEAAEAIAVAARYPQNPECAEIMDRWRKHLK